MKRKKRLPCPKCKRTFARSVNSAGPETAGRQAMDELRRAQRELEPQDFRTFRDRR